MPEEIKYGWFPRYEPFQDLTDPEMKGTLFGWSLEAYGIGDVAMDLREQEQKRVFAEKISIILKKNQVKSDGPRRKA